MNVPTRKVGRLLSGALVIACSATTHAQLDRARGKNDATAPVVEIVGEIPDGTPSEPAPPQPLPEFEVFATDRHPKKDGREVIIHRVKAPDIDKLVRQHEAERAKEIERLQKLAPKGKELERLVEEFSDQVRIFLSVTVYDHEMTHLRWRHDGERYEAWVQADFNLVAGLSHFKIDGRHFFLYMGFGNTKREWHDPEVPPGWPPDLGDDPPKYALIKGDPRNEAALLGVESLLEVYAQRHDELEVAHEKRVAAYERQRQWLKDNPPQPRDSELYVWVRGDDDALKPKPRQLVVPKRIGNLDIARERQAAAEALEANPPKRRPLKTAPVRRLPRKGGRQVRTAFASLLVAAIGAAPLLGQSEIDAKLVYIPSVGWEVEWDSQTDRTYFVLTSDDMFEWTYQPWVSAGTGNDMGYGVTPSNPDIRFFAKVRWSDQPLPTNPPPGYTPAEFADFDGDTIPNLDEVEIYFTDPFKVDSDDDGMSDNWEIAQGLDPADGGVTTAEGPYGDHDGDGVTNLREYLLELQNNAVDSDGDSVPDGYDAHPAVSAIAWTRLAFDRYRVEELGDPGTLGDPLDVNDRGDVLFERHVWRGGHGSSTALAGPTNPATYHLIETGDATTPPHIGAPISTTSVEANGNKPDNLNWDPIAINNLGKVVGNARYYVDNEWFFIRGLYWTEPSAAPSVTDPAHPLLENQTIFYDLTHDGRILGADTQDVENSFGDFHGNTVPIPGFPGLRRDLVAWSKGQRPYRLASFNDLGYFPPELVFHDGLLRPVAGDHNGTLLFDISAAFDANERQPFDPESDLDIARIDDAHLATVDYSGLDVNGVEIPELAGTHITPGGQVLDENQLWFNGVRKALDTWVQPDPTLQQWTDIHGYAISDGGVIAATAKNTNGVERLVVLYPAYRPHTTRCPPTTRPGRATARSPSTACPCPTRRRRPRTRATTPRSRPTSTPSTAASSIA